MEQLLVDLFGSEIVAKVILWATMLVTVATFITSLFPSLHGNKFFGIVLKVLNVLAGNIGKNKNADAVK